MLEHQETAIDRDSFSLYNKIMSGLLKKVKKAAFETGQAMKKDPLFQRVSENIKETAQSFIEGYRERQDQQIHCRECQRGVSAKDKFCPHCGTKLR